MPFDHRLTTSVPRPSPPQTAALTALGLTAVAALAWYAVRKPTVPEGISPVDDFDLQQYQGTWYELARIDHRFERGLQRTQADYVLAPDGSLRVTNRGYDPESRRWKVATGKGRTVQGAGIGALKVSFFGPFYGGYNVVALDPRYRWAMVVGSSLDYFWILSRTPTLPSGVQERLMRQAALMGVPTERVHWVHQDGVNPTGS